MDNKYIDFHYNDKCEKCQPKYLLYRLVNGEWCFWGQWDNAIGLCAAANSLGLDGFYTKVEVNN